MPGFKPVNAFRVLPRFLGLSSRIFVGSHPSFLIPNLSSPQVHNPSILILCALTLCQVENHSSPGLWQSQDRNVS
jgi:hypothetical protein